MDLHADSTEGTCHLTKLSTELILQIVDYIPPASHLDFACTCKYILACSSDVLTRHYEAHTKYSVSSDLKPDTVPTLLRSAFGYGDPILAWHVRSFEIWHDRNSWDEWKTFGFQSPLSDDTENEPISWEYFYGECEDYLKPLEYGNEPSRALEFGRAQIENGHDGILKAVLLANCPRLRDVRAVTPGTNSVFDRTSCLGWLEAFIKDVVHGLYAWPPGLANVQSVAVGIPSHTWMDPPLRVWNHRRNTGQGQTDLLIHLLQLPNIQTLYLKDYTRTRRWHDERDFTTLLPARCSSVKHLFLDNCDQLGYHFGDALVAAPKELITASFRAGNARLEDADSIVSGFGHHHRNSLASLMFYGYGRSGAINGYRCNSFRPEALQKFKVLRNVSIDIQDVELDALYEAGNDYYTAGKKEEGESNGAFLERVFVHCFPKSMETLTFWNQLGSGHMCWEPSDEAGLESAVIKLIESKRYENLKAIFLEKVERARHEESDRGTHTEALWFRKAIEVGKKFNVDVHTITNRGKMVHAIDFPEAPDKYDLATGPWGKRPSDWVFDPYKGRRVPPGCGKCGSCEVCLLNYSKELWETLEDA